MRKIWFWARNNYIILFYILIFILILSVSYFVPLAGDDWNNYLVGSNGFKNIWSYAIYCFNTFEGRFFSRIFDCVLVYHKWLWMIINASIFTLIFLAINKIVNNKYKIITCILTLLLILLVDYETFAQGYVWLTGNITYFIPMGFAFYVLLTQNKIFDQNPKNSKTFIIIVSLCSFVFSMFVENVTIGIITIFILLSIIHLCKYKKLNKFYLFSLILSVLGFVLMLTSPGTLARIDTVTIFEGFSFWDKILYNFPRLIKYTFIKNPLLIIILSTVSSLIMLKKEKNMFIKYVAIAFLVIIPFITAAAQFLIAYNNLNIPKIGFFINTDNIFVLLYWLFYIAAIIILIVKYTERLKIDQKIFYIIIAMSSNTAMLISPYWGGRTALFTTFMLFIVTLLMLDEINIKILKNKILIFVLMLFVIFVSIKTFIRYFEYSLIAKYRDDFISYQLESDSDNENLKVVQLPNKYLWNADPWEDWHRKTFKRYKKIPEEKKLIFVELTDEIINISKNNDKK